MSKTIGGISMFALWLGAAVSLAEVMTGSLLAPLGLQKGIIVILAGHLIGTLILAAVGVIGFREKKTAIESAKLSFGKYGSNMVAILNCIQLIGWTSIMLIQCSKSLQVVTQKLFGFNNFTVLTVLAGALVLIWTLSEHKGTHLINNLAVTLLFGLCVAMGLAVLKGQGVVPATGDMTLAAGLELSVVMPLSWIPLISDYTRSAKSGRGSFWGSFLGYFLGSSFMYIIGLASAIYTGSPDPIEILMKLNMGFAAVMIIILSTVTTTFLDVYSTVMSTTSVTQKFSRKTLIVVFTALSTGLALYFPMESYTDFLYMIGSVFAPVFTIVLLDYYILKKNYSQFSFNVPGLIAAAVGVYAYYQLAAFNLILGTSVPAMLVTGAVYLVLVTVSKYIRQHHQLAREDI
ncbi:putative hydroxymethylpyrimidine transporter CytX [Desulfotomaculum nigrificans]|uniref:putative hydroxymethylpyrimidine transporter CytX n=1 Tax=Desulfotomaculum nigrificans TaxID=1565 RepID=UPI000488CA91|nr:putative hydroxymethylpyrimidine transporter CytX [Desulfotomaculum nigrificans]